MKKTTTIFALYILVGFAQADQIIQETTNQDITVGIHMFSYHDKPGYNNTNPGLYLKYRHWTVGTYFNSLKKNSTYFGYNFEYPLKDRFVDSLDLTLGVITGYQKKIGNLNVSALVVPSVRIDVAQKTSIRITYVPRIREYNDTNVIHLSLERRL